MKSHSRGRRRLTVLAVALVATIAAVLAAVPAVASAQNSLSLSIDPPVPPKGKPFQMIAQGTGESPGGQFDVTVYFAPGTRACASTSTLEEANSAGLQEIIESRFNPNGEVFDERGTYSGEPFVPYSVKSGLATGHYRACGYLSDTADNDRTLVTTRLEFTAGGTCDSVTAKVAEAEKQLKRAKKQLEAATETGDSTEIKKAKKKVKNAKKKLKAAKEDREALC